MRANTFICSLPHTKPANVTYFSTTDVFRVPNATVSVDDPDGSLRTALLLVPDHIPTLNILVSDASKAYSFRDAMLAIIELDGNEGVSLMFHCAKEDMTQLSLGA